MTNNCLPPPNVWPKKKKKIIIKAFDSMQTTGNDTRFSVPYFVSALQLFGPQRKDSWSCGGQKRKFLASPQLNRFFFFPASKLTSFLGIERRSERSSRTGSTWRHNFVDPHCRFGNPKSETLMPEAATFAPGYSVSYVGREGNDFVVICPSPPAAVPGILN